MADSEPELFVAIAALVVSIVALLATFMQVIQQYYASASGYSKCNEKVMGGWAKTKSRRFSWEELRYEVQFDAPVIFVSPPTNELGPVRNAPILVLDGTEESKKKTNTTSNVNDSENKMEKKSIHTADNERASWLVLLNAVQDMESASSAWQKDQYRLLTSLGPPGNNRPGLPPKPPSFRDYHTLAVAVQRKRKTWDTIPSSVSRPYATTTICHLVEMMAALGVYWKEFDRNRDRYRAEGNGFMVIGERLRDLGLIFSFQVYGVHCFQHNRVIPVDDVKELCFGFVPTISRETVEHRRLEVPMSSLHMATRRDISETLVAIGCNKNTVRCFTNESGKTTHLFPLSFEIIGMVARTFHINNSCFTYLPNPTPDCWKEKSLSLSKILEAYELYRVLFEEETPGLPRNATIHSRIARHIREILSYQGNTEDILRLQALHSALDDADEVLTARVTDSRRDVANWPGNGKPQGSDTSAGDSSGYDEPRERAQQLRRDVVQDVLRFHIQEVVRLLNESDRSPDGQTLQVPEAPSASSGGRRRTNMDEDALRFEDIDESSPDGHLVFMNVYFRVVREQAVKLARESAEQRLAREEAAKHAHTPAARCASFAGRQRRRNTGETTVSAAKLDPLKLEVPGTTRLQDEDTGSAADGIELGEMSSVATPQSPDGGMKPSLADESVSYDDIWCVLIFRMICWLMLHDFDERDVQVSKSELIGNRMPVYIS